MSARSSPRNISIQARDIRILRGLFESRIMTLSHIAELYFENRSDAAKKCVQRLRAARLVRERPRKPFEPSILSLDIPAIKMLKSEGHLSGYPSLPMSMLERRGDVSDLTIRHELQVMDFKARFTNSLRNLPDFELEDFVTWPKLVEFDARPDQSRGYGRAPVLVKPDGFIRLTHRINDDIYEHCFFVEIDRSTESQHILARRAACYLDYYRSGGFAVWRGGKRQNVEDYPFRVLLICRTKERANNAAEQMLLNNPPIRSIVWLTAFDDAMNDPFGEIWMRPTDYAAIVQDTAFAPAPSRRGVYRRNTERETLVDRSVTRLALFNNIQTNPSASLP